MNTANSFCMKERPGIETNGHLVDSNTLLIELSSPSVKSGVYG